MVELKHLPPPLGTENPLPPIKHGAKESSRGPSLSSSTKFNLEVQSPENTGSILSYRAPFFHERILMQVTLTPPHLTRTSRPWCALADERWCCPSRRCNTGARLSLAPRSPYMYCIVFWLSFVLRVFCFGDRVALLDGQRDLIWKKTRATMKKCLVACWFHITHRYRLTCHCLAQSMGIRAAAAGTDATASVEVNDAKSSADAPPISREAGRCGGRLARYGGVTRREGKREDMSAKTLPIGEQRTRRGLI